MQSQRDFELIIWNDGSTDQTGRIIDGYAKLDRRITAIHAAKQEFVRSVRDAHRLATGDYIGVIDSDDLLHPDALKLTCEVLDQNPRVGMVYTNYQDIDTIGKDLGLGRRCKIPYSPDRLLVDFMTFHFRLIRHSAFKKVGGIEIIHPYCYDYDLSLRIAEKFQVYHLERSLYYYRKHDRSISISRTEQQRSCAFKIAQAALLRRKMNKTHILELTSDHRFVLRNR